MTKIIEGKDLVNMQFVETEDGLLKRYEKKGRFMPQLNQRYWFVGIGGSIDDLVNNGSIYDKWCLKHNLVFETEEDCKKYRDYLIALDEYSYDFTREEWEDIGINKYALWFNSEDKKINISCLNIAKYEVICFKSEKDARAFIYEVGEEAIEKFMFGYYR